MSDGREAPPWAALEAAAARVVLDFRAAPAAVVAGAMRLPGGGWLRGTGRAGRLSYEPGSQEVGVETPFDLASVTKPWTALTALRLARRGDLDLDAPLATLCARFAGTPAGSRSLGLLLRHRSGLEAHREFFAPLRRGEAVDREAAFQEAARAMRPGAEGPLPPEGAPAVYSDLGYLLAGAALEEVTGKALEALMEEEVSLPVGSGATSARGQRARDAHFDERVAPTEEVAFRGGLVRGEVHDENAWAIAGPGVCGHAGLFGTALDVLALGEALLDALADGAEDWLGPSDLDPALTPWPGGTHVLGFDTKSGPTPSAGRRFGARTFGHLGFTGTSLWMDPEQGLVGVLLTNRVHPTRDHVAIRAARPVVYDAIADALKTTGSLRA